MKHFSIRSYNKISHSHYHQYHQLVLPLHGVINIHVGDYSGLVGLGDCVIIRAGQHHAFSAQEAARFIVVDSDTLPSNILTSSSEKIAIDEPLIAFCQFLERQLNTHQSQNISQSAFVLFNHLLMQQQGAQRIDKRLEAVLALINDDLSRSYTLAHLAATACLSQTQFKVVFKHNMAMTAQQYIRQRRMEKAKALLTYTDKPIAIVAQEVGYLDNSAFSRQFKNYSGHPPSKF